MERSAIRPLRDVSRITLRSIRLQARHALSLTHALRSCPDLNFALQHITSLACCSLQARHRRPANNVAST
jgi:hypothetical protein